MSNTLKKFKTVPYRLTGSARYFAKIAPYLASFSGDREPTMTGTIWKLFLKLWNVSYD